MQQSGITVEFPGTFSIWQPDSTLSPCRSRVLTRRCPIRRSRSTGAWSTPSGVSLAITQRPGGCLWQDLLDGVLPGNADVALVLKTLPCLERQKPGAAIDLMYRLEDIPKVVVSYPVRSLGGARKNMPQTYRAQAQSLAATCGRDIAFLDLSQEIVAVLSHR